MFDKTIFHKSVCKIDFLQSNLIGSCVSSIDAFSYVPICFLDFFLSSFILFSFRFQLIRLEQFDFSTMALNNGSGSEDMYNRVHPKVGSKIMV